MNTNRLGKSSIVVSDICMGTMTFGNQADEKTAFRIMDMAYDAGVDFYDTAEMYPVPPDTGYVGVTEEIVEKLGRVKEEMQLPIYEPKREEQVFRNITGSNHGPLPEEALKRLFERIVDEMRTLQRLNREKRAVNERD